MGCGASSLAELEEQERAMQRTVVDLEPDEWKDLEEEEENSSNQAGFEPGTPLSDDDDDDSRSMSGYSPASGISSGGPRPGALAPLGPPGPLAPLGSSYSMSTGKDSSRNLVAPLQKKTIVSDGPTIPPGITDEWYFPDIPREDAEEKLRAAGGKVFLVRDSSRDGCFALSKYNSATTQLVHIIIMDEGDGWFLEGDDDGTPTRAFRNITELLKDAPDLVGYRSVSEPLDPTELAAFACSIPGMLEELEGIFRSHADGPPWYQVSRILSSNSILEPLFASVLFTEWDDLPMDDTRMSSRAWDMCLAWLRDFKDPLRAFRWLIETAGRPEFFGFMDPKEASEKLVQMGGRAWLLRMSSHPGALTLSVRGTTFAALGVAQCEHKRVFLKEIPGMDYSVEIESELLPPTFEGPNALDKMIAAASKKSLFGDTLLGESAKR